LHYLGHVKIFYEGLIRIELDVSLTRLRACGI